MASRFELWTEARRLVVAEGQSYAEVADTLGLALSTLEKRGAAEGWQAQRQHAMSYDAQMRAIKAQYATQLIDMVGDLDKIGKATQLMLALTNLEKAYPEHKYTRKSVDPKARLAMGAEFLQFLVTTLGGLDRNAVTLLEPHIDAIAAAWEDHVAA